MNDKPHFEEGLGDIGSVNGQPVVCGNFQLYPRVHMFLQCMIGGNLTLDVLLIP